MPKLTSPKPAWVGCPARVDLAVGILDEEAAALARRFLVEGDLLEPGDGIGDRERCCCGRASPD